MLPSPTPAAQNRASIETRARHERDASETRHGRLLALLLVAGCSVPAEHFTAAGDAGMDGNGSQGLEASVTTYDFGTVVVGTASGPASITFTNRGAVDTAELAPAGLGGVAVSQFSISQDGCAGHLLRPGEQCVVAIMLTASSSGSLAAELTVAAMPGGTSRVALSATVVEKGALRFSPASHDFGSLPPGQTSSDVTFTAANTGGASTGTIAVSLSGSDASQFAIVTDSCNGTILAGGGMCTVTARFAPTVAGTKAATLIATTSAAGTAVSTLGGKSLSAAQLTTSISSDDFGDVVIGGASASFAVSFTNTGELPSGPLAISISGTDAAAFQLPADTCTSNPLAPGASCQVQITFTPVNAGLASAVVVALASPGGSVHVGVTGTGLPPAALAFTPSANDFGNQDVATIGVPTMFTLTNSGGQATTAITTSLAGTNASDFLIFSDGCNGQILAVSASCPMMLVFRPATFGSRTATLRATAVVGGTTTSSLVGNGRDKLVLTVHLDGGDGTGTVTDDVGMLTCGGTLCTGLYYRGTHVTLTAVPDATMQFGSWSGACAGTSICNVPMLVNTTVTATFQQANEKLMLSTMSIGAGTGTIISAPAGTSCGTGCLSFPTGTPVTLTAVPDAGFYLGSWSGDCVGNGPTCALTMTAAHTAGATFSPANRVFITSGTFVPQPGDPVAWADMTCQGAADAAGLPGTYVGWIGAGAANWPTHLGSASGWVRLDGKPFATTRAAFLARHTLYSITVTEHGDAVPPTTLVNSGLPGNDCSGWTQTSGGFQVPGMAGGGWGRAAILDDISETSCGTPLPLYCFETDYNVNVTYTRITGRAVFVASSVPIGGGAAAFDALCATRAAGAGLPGSFKALLATTTASAASRFTTAGTFVRTDGVPVAAAADLLQAAPALSAPLEIDEMQGVANVQVVAGASSLVSTATPDSNCNDYTAVSSERFPDGVPGFIDALFFGDGLTTCDQSLSAYCLQQ